MILSSIARLGSVMFCAWRITAGTDNSHREILLPGFKLPGKRVQFENGRAQAPGQKLYPITTSDSSVFSNDGPAAPSIADSER